jgi:hypothetical protein
MRTAVALTLVIVLLAAGIVDAKVLWHVGGEVVDSRGVLVGRIATFGGTVPAVGLLPASIPPEPGLPMVLLQVNDITFPLFVSTDVFQAVTWLFFPTADCSGPGFMSNPGATPVSQVALRGFEVFTFDATATNALITARSASRGGACVAATMDVQVVPAELLIDFTDRWVPPFAIR